MYINILITNKIVDSMFKFLIASLWNYYFYCFIKCTINQRYNISPSRGYRQRDFF